MKEACSECDWVRAKRQYDFYRSSNEEENEGLHSHRVQSERFELEKTLANYLYSLSLIHLKDNS